MGTTAMNGALIHELMVSLRDLICLAYRDDEFGTLMFKHAYVHGFDYAGLPGAYEVKAFEAVRWALRYGDAPQVLWLAELVAANRPKRKDAKQLVKAIQAAIGAAPPDPGDGNQPSPSAALPTELTASLGLYENKQSGLQDLVLDLRPKLRANSYDQYDLPGRFHLSESEGHRLVAVLALETHPIPQYLRWLSERVTVEQPLVGFTAAQGLTTAALRLSRAELSRVRQASESASDRLDGLVEIDDTAPNGPDVAARKRQLQLALALVDMRGKKGKSVMEPAELDAFLTALIEVFDRDAFDQMCKEQLGTSLKWLANPNDPIELIMVSVAVTARDKGWERDLVRAAYQARAQNQSLATVYQKYGSPPGGG